VGDCKPRRIYNRSCKERDFDHSGPEKQHDTTSRSNVLHQLKGEQERISQTAPMTTIEQLQYGLTKEIRRSEQTDGRFKMQD